MRTLAAACAYSFLLLSCASSPTEIIVEKRVAVFAPAQLTEDCPVNYGDKSLGAAVQALGAAVRCERAKNAAERAWRQAWEKNTR